MGILRNIRDHIRISRMLKKIYKEENLLTNLSGLLGVEFKQDWVGRLYAVVNPYIQNMNEAGNTVIYDGSNSPMIERWVMDNLNLIRKFVTSNDLFDMLGYEIRKIDEDGNYLIIFKPILFDTMIHYAKIGAWILGGLALIGIGFLIF